MSGNGNRMIFEPIVESEVATNPEDGTPRSGTARPFSANSKGLAIPENLTIGNNGMSRLLTVEDVAALLNVPPRWVYRHAELKPPEGIPHVKVGKYLRFRESDLREYVERLRRN